MTAAEGKAGPVRERVHRYRSMVLAALTMQGAPSSAQSLHAALRGRGERIGLSTVYRELHVLAQTHQVEEAFVSGESVYRVSARDLLVCDDCGRTEEVGDGLTGDAAVDRFFDAGRPLTVHGICAVCASGG